MICDVALPEAERQIEVLTEVSAELAVELAIAKKQVDDLLQEKKKWFTKTINGPN